MKSLVQSAQLAAFRGGIQTQTDWLLWLLAATPDLRLISQESPPPSLLHHPASGHVLFGLVFEGPAVWSQCALPAWRPTNGMLPFPTCAVPMPFPPPGRLPLENEDFGAWLCHRGCV